jgi:hypothetical protein
MAKFLIVHPEELSEKWIDRLMCLGVDTLGIHSVGGTQAHEYLSKMIEEQKRDEVKALFDLAVADGLNIEYELHAASYLLPRELFESHPEYFRVDANGERTPNSNFCVSNKEALDFVSKRAAELADTLYMSSDKFYFWLDDGKDLHCHCEKCRELSPSDQQLLALNSMLAAMKEKRPNAKLAYLAYCTTTDAPKKIKPHKDIFLEYAPFERDRKQPARVMSEAERKNIVRLFEVFGKKDSKILEYWYDNSMFSGWKKPPKAMTVDNEMLIDDVDFYRELGFENIGSFACYLGSDYEGLHGEPDLSAFKNI